jgi:excisionase family DNA binding protein
MNITLYTEDQALEVARRAACLAVEATKKPDTPEIMTLSQVAEYLQFTTQTIQNKIRSGGLPVSYRMGDPRFIKKEIDEWLKSN